VVGGADGAAQAAAGLGQVVRRVQSGYLRGYATVFALGGLVILLVVGLGWR